MSKDKGKMDENSVWFRYFWYGKNYASFWQVKDTTCTNFKCVQSIRLLMIAILLGVWFTVFYILVRQILFFVSFYASTLQLAAQLLLAISAGRLVVETKMLKKLNEEKKKNFSKVNKFFSQGDMVEQLPEEDQSSMWRAAIMLYTVSTPLVWISLILFYTTRMKADIFCDLSKLGAANKTSFPITDCYASKDPFTTGNYDNAGWRWGMFQAGLIVPCVVNLVEMCLNRLLLRFRHAFIVFGFTLVYMGINLLGCLMQGGLYKQVYPNLVVW